MNDNSEVREVLVTGLKNAHAMEKQALSIMKPQAKRIENYSELRGRIEDHITETEGQIERLDSILSQLDESPSAFKDATLSMGGAMAAVSHAAAGDEILKDTFADYAFEHYEIAAYKSLIDLAQRAELKHAVPLLEQTLDEEENMAQWLEDHVGLLTEKYLALRVSDATAKR